ncbi:hypothetical protein SOLON_79 [Mycobacterium phage Solon]|uniref:Uncharacterized protein n=1 Tax=Mycobacterium phage Solon TaxID=555603 RepID=B5LLT2_9CAUD|nr:hypothetical protein SOLON_79 [Mycobacterium phage Solon]ACH62978.1 hypothetical protein SOLON_79 [Mycobacterium phage Solon]
MLRREDLRKAAGEDVSGLSRDVLEFNYRLLAKQSLDMLEELDRQHGRETAQLRELIGVGQIVAVLLAAAQRAGKKTVRVDDVLTQAYARLSDEGSIPGAEGRPGLDTGRDRRRQSAEKFLD